MKIDFKALIKLHGLNVVLEDLLLAVNELANPMSDKIDLLACYAIRDSLSDLCEEAEDFILENE